MRALLVSVAAAGALTLAGITLVPRSAYADAGDAALAAAKADANANANAGVSEVPPEAHDLGTRWVLLAAVGGIVAGGAIARYRKKRAPP